MDLLIKKWVENNITNDIGSCYFCSNIGIVFLGIKPSVIIYVSKENFNKCILLKNHLSFKVLGKKDEKYKLFLYNSVALEETLNRTIVLKYLRELGYSKHFTLHDYVSTLIYKLKYSEYFPHEIGFFLGYPVKDVLSFMGRINLPFVKTMGWQMYGNTKESEKLYYNVNKAKNEIINYGKQMQNRVS